MQKAVPKYHPVATSAAAETIKKHEKPANTVLWAGWFCPFTQRSWVVLEELGIPYQYKEVNPYLKEASFLEISPKGLTPGLQVDGKPLHDSIIINEFLNEEYGSSKLLPEDPYQRTIARLWIDYINKEVVPAFFRLLQAQPNEPEKQSSALIEFKNLLSTISKKAKGLYFFGDQFSLVDAALAPWAVRDFIVRDFRRFVREDVQGWSDWAAALETRESVVRTTSGKIVPKTRPCRFKKEDHLTPPFTAETAQKKVKAAQDAWNTRNPDGVKMAYTPDSIWRNRDQFLQGRDAIKDFLTKKWEKENGYRLRKELFAFTDNKIAVQFWYEWYDEAGQWWRTYGLEDWTFAENGLMRKRQMSGNDVKISDDERWFKDGVDVNEVDISEKHW
ncbi:hypothetical protein TrVGV298_007745 [Trichoderma virens]|nr:hypothetical protein TrVGV298_007745 [Trichoderma virens]